MVCEIIVVSDGKVLLVMGRATAIPVRTRNGPYQSHRLTRSSTASEALASFRAFLEDGNLPGELPTQCPAMCGFASDRFHHLVGHFEHRDWREDVCQNSEKLLVNYLDDDAVKEPLQGYLGCETRQYGPQRQYQSVTNG
ncbi:hypothetical protein SUNI508_03035 [Seiridium unicorne]|uniref:C2H2-type domain-containing protein n=1 Tax=Seiridium unicorne TaxID=138068 RepID=A0ABR2VFI6_9PEZI